MKNFDPWCGELAEKFLQLEPQEVQDKLAQHIQDAIEDWLEQLDAENNRHEDHAP